VLAFCVKAGKWTSAKHDRRRGDCQWENVSNNPQVDPVILSSSNGSYCNLLYQNGTQGSMAHRY